MRVQEVGERSPEFAGPLLTIYGLNLYDGWQERIELLENAVDPQTLRYEHDPQDLHLPRSGLNIKDDFREINPKYQTNEFLDEIEQQVAVILRFAGEIITGREYSKATFQEMGKLVVDLGNTAIENYLKIPQDAIPIFGQSQRDAQNEALAALRSITTIRFKRQISRYLEGSQLANIAA